MIFVTVGTHEQPFNRLVEYIDNLKGDRFLQEDVIIQIGYSTFVPKHCIWSKLFTYQDMSKYVSEARIVVTHGGPSSFIMALQAGKIPIVVPRQKQFNEHVNDHQVDFSKEVEMRQRNIIAVTEIEKLHDILLNYDSVVARMTINQKINNAFFNEQLENIVNGLLST